MQGSWTWSEIMNIEWYKACGKGLILITEKGEWPFLKNLKEFKAIKLSIVIQLNFIRENTNYFNIMWET